MRPGANSIVGAEAAARAPADGYTFVQLNDAASTLNIALYPKLPYHTLKDFAPLTRAGSIAMVLVVHPAVPATSVEEYLAWARAGRDINFGSGGVGSAQHVLMEMLMYSTGLRLTHVPYRGVIPAMNDVVAGHIPTMIVGLAGSLGAIRSGLLRAIAMTGPKRAAELPDVPTLAEKGIAGFPAEPWTAFYAPAGTPAPILATLSAGLVETLSDPGVREKLKPVMEVETSTPEALRGMVERDIERYGKLVRDVGMKAE
jgi:tripartite-type tricarboxylate transporter receptor subunit TctC